MLVKAAVCAPQLLHHGRKLVAPRVLPQQGRNARDIRAFSAMSGVQAAADVYHMGPGTFQ